MIDVRVMVILAALTCDQVSFFPFCLGEGKNHLVAGYGHPGFKTEKINNNRTESLFRLNFNVYVDVDNRERVSARDNKGRRQIS